MYFISCILKCLICILLHTILLHSAYFAINVVLILFKLISLFFSGALVILLSFVSSGKLIFILCTSSFKPFKKKILEWSGQSLWHSPLDGSLQFDWGPVNEAYIFGPAVFLFSCHVMSSSLAYLVLENRSTLSKTLLRPRYIINAAFPGHMKKVTQSKMRQDEPANLFWGLSSSYHIVFRGLTQWPFYVLLSSLPRIWCQKSVLDLSFPFF